MASLKTRVYGHDRIFKSWSQRREKGQASGTFLLVGPPGVGKLKSALAMAQESLCEIPSRAPCGDCPSCRRVEAGHHESLLKIIPTNGGIKIEQSHEILQFLQLQSLTPHRFVLIEDCHLLNISAANSLLKTLEEPPSDTTLFLTAPSVTGVIPTIRSRSRVFHFTAVPPELMVEKGAGPEWAIWAAQGRFDRLRNLSDAQMKERRHDWAAFLTQFLFHEDLLIEDSWREKIKNREEVREAIEMGLSLTRDALFLQLGEKKTLFNLDLLSTLQRWAQLPREKLEFLAQFWVQLQRETQFNKDAVLSFESLSIQLKRM